MNDFNTKDLLGALSVILTFITYSSYFVSVLRRTTKPHMFSWIIWTIMNGVAFFAQYIKGAGAGAWATGFSTILSVVVTIFAITFGEKNITRSDRLAFLGAILAIFLWYLTDDPYWSVILVSIIDMAACYPTLRKSFEKPWDEPGSIYGLASLRGLLAFGAVSIYSVETALFPIVMVMSNGAIAIMIYWRRAILVRPR